MFKIGDFYYPDGGGSFWETLFISLLCATLGIGGAWLIFKKSIKHERKVDDNKRAEYLISRMRFLLLLLDEVILTTNKQVENFILQAEDILGNPYEYHLVKILASNQLQRLTKIDTQDIFEAYIYLFKNNQDTIKKYIKLLNYLDFLEIRISQVFVSNESNVKAIGKRQDQMRVYVDQLYSDFPKFCNAEQSMKDVWKSYFPIFESFVGSGRVSVQNLHQDFLIPLFKSVKLIEAEDRENQILFIASIRNATTTIEHYKNNNLVYGLNDALSMKRDLKDVLEALKKYSQEIQQKLSTIV